MSAPTGGFVLVRDDGVDDAFTRQRFASYDAAYDVLERYYGYLCCSDERVYYQIVVVGDR